MSFLTWTKDRILNYIYTFQFSDMIIVNQTCDVSKMSRVFLLSQQLFSLLSLLRAHELTVFLFLFYPYIDIIVVTHYLDN